MGYGLTYRMKFTNQEGFGIICLIQDTTTFAPNVEENIKELTASGDPLHISIVDTNEDKYTPIRAKRAVAKILSDININVSLFALNSTDNRWLVDIYVDNPLNPLFLGEHHPIFTGFLVLNDLNEPFLDSFNNQIITLTASDGLGLLKDVPLTKPDGTNPKGEFTIIQYISWCLQKTGLKLPINVMNNLMEESLIGLPAYNNIKLSAKTFESDQIGVSLKCYEVLTRILGEECYLVQWKDQWWIKRIDEIEDQLNYFDSYDYQGIYIGSSNNNNYFKNIGLDQPIELIAPATMVSFERPHGDIKESYTYEYPKEIPDNVDFSRGNLIVPIRPGTGGYILNFPTKNDFPNQGDSNKVYHANDTQLYWIWNGTVYRQAIQAEIPFSAAYQVEDWTYGRFHQDDPTIMDNATGASPYITRIYFDGNERERFVVIPFTADDNPTASLRSNIIYVNEKDKISISVDFRFSYGGVADHVNIFSVQLIGDDGSIYYSNDSGFWFLSVPGLANIQYNQYEYKNGQDKTNWASLSLNLDPLPVSGSVYIYLNNGYLNGADSFPEINFQNLTFNIETYINGSYQKYNGQYNKVFQNPLYKAIRENPVYIADSPRKSFKGALLKTVNNKIVSAGKWVNGAVPALRIAPVDPKFIHPLGFIQAFSVWNQYRREMRRLDFQASGLDSGTDIPDLLHNYIFSDYSPHTYGKKFLLIHYDQDLYSCKWKGHLQEVFDINYPKVYNDNFEFKFIENR